MENFSSEAFRSYAFYGSICVVKVLVMAVLTAKQRFRKKAFANPEDAKMDKSYKVTTSDEDVERVRRAHLNDMENIFPFLFLGILYCYTGPSGAVANLLFKIFTAARIVHTVVYAVYPLPQPARGLAFGAGMFVNLFMAYKIIMFFW